MLQGRMSNSSIADWLATGPQKLEAPPYAFTLQQYVNQQMSRPGGVQLFRNDPGTPANRLKGTIQQPRRVIGRISS